ncbi:MAG: Eco57I restriction-modification methylase domain-containing protein, partial [Cyanobacteriota bacterium]
MSDEIILRPRRIKSSLNKNVLKENIQINDFNNFKNNLEKLINETEKSGNNSQGEENVKNILSDFLKESFYKNKYSINTMSYKGRNEADLVIHSELNQDSNVSVIFEVKTLKNKVEMLSKEVIEKKSPDTLLKTSFYEAVLYFFHEFIGKNNIELKNIIITNVFEYFIFDANEFKRVFIDRSKILFNIYEKWKTNNLIDAKTDTFYSQVKEYITNHPEYLNNLRFTYFDIREIKDDDDLKLLYKFFSPKHLLKQSFNNDSNILNKEFYNELLHIIGLEEVEKGSQKLIKRKKEIDSSSLIENTINIIEEKEKLDNLKNKSNFGNNKEEILFNVSLSLCIRWINRILFLKLLEGQLYNYHNGDKNYKFLDSQKIKNFDNVSKLFFSVLAKKMDDRKADIQKEFFRVPYLNSSLFEITLLENELIDISSLDNNLELPVYKNTILKDNKGKKLTGNIPTLKYLLEFLNSYDFGAEEVVKNDLTEESKTLINASVLGLIFEKINGYKDGSFYTPSFITTYMCRETISRIIIQKFNEKYNFENETLEELSDFILRKKIDLKEANDLVNSIKICDPAVGSGHFLVSALNEIIAIKSQLYILCDIEYKKLNVSIENQNDELVVKDLRTDDFFEYKVKSYTNYNPINREVSKELTRIQKTLFLEKKNLIESCLFGVDINNNSVMICRLRLWIELLKNAFYTEESDYKELETLPNIDINIKQGNSLISRYNLDVNLKTVFNKKGFSVKEYRDKVREYKETNSKDIKKDILKYIEDIKSQFKSDLAIGFLTKIQSIENELKQISLNLFGLDKETKRKIADKKKKLDEMLKDKEEIESSIIYKDAFEWRFEFPELLDSNGDFIGFDAIIGNPPYIQIQTFTITQKESWKKQNYQTFEATGDIYCLFYEKGNQILRNNGILSYITSNKWMRAGYGESTRNYFCENTNPLLLIDLGGFSVFDFATVDTNILLFKKIEKSYIYEQDNLLSCIISNKTIACSIQKDFKNNYSLQEYVKKNQVILDNLTKESWIILSKKEFDIKKKIEEKGIPLKDCDILINRGVTTGLNEAFIIDEKKKTELIKLDPKNAEIIKPILRGRDIKKYKSEFANLWIISTFPSLKINIDKYPLIRDYLKTFGKKIEQTGEIYIDELGNKIT